jgi:hypothetical protein
MQLCFVAPLDLVELQAEPAALRWADLIVGISIEAMLLALRLDLLGALVAVAREGFGRVGRLGWDGQFNISAASPT